MSSRPHAFCPRASLPRPARSHEPEWLRHGPKLKLGNVWSFLVIAGNLALVSQPAHRVHFGISALTTIRALNLSVRERPDLLADTQEVSWQPFVRGIDNSVII